MTAPRTAAKVMAAIDRAYDEWTEDPAIPVTSIGTRLIDEALAEAVAPFREALIWMSGSDDFAPGGKAREGFEKIVLPLAAAGGGGVSEYLGGQRHPNPPPGPNLIVLGCVKCGEKHTVPLPPCLLPDDDTAVEIVKRALREAGLHMFYTANPCDDPKGFQALTPEDAADDLVAALRGVASEGRDSTEGGQR